MQKVRIGESEPRGDRYELLLTNVRFAESQPAGCYLAVTDTSHRLSLRILPLPGYSDRVSFRHRRGHGPIPTASMTIVCPTLKGAELEMLVSHLCVGLSVLQGQGVNWIYWGTFRKGRLLESAIFGGSVTKRFGAPPLCFQQGFPSLELDLQLVGDAVQAIRSFREDYDPHNMVINAWLDARAEGDYLEARTLQSVVVVEMLIALTVQRPRSTLIERSGRTSPKSALLPISPLCHAPPDCSEVAGITSPNLPRQSEGKLSSSQSAACSGRTIVFYQSSKSDCS